MQLGESRTGHDGLTLYLYLYGKNDRLPRERLREQVIVVAR
jgi:hypothetical protein